MTFTGTLNLLTHLRYYLISSYVNNFCHFHFICEEIVIIIVILISRSGIILLIQHIQLFKEMLCTDLKHHSVPYILGNG